MKALFISNDPTVFDETSATRARMRAYAAWIGELHILSASPVRAHDTQEGSLFLHPVHVGKFLRISVLTHRARKIILEKGIEIVSAQDPFEHGLIALRAVRGTPAKLHIQVHTDFLSPWFVKGSIKASFLNRHRRVLAHRVLPAAQGIRVVSERIKKSLVAQYGTHIPEPTIIPVAVDIMMPTSTSFPTHLFKFALVAVGRLEREKRIEDILAALKLVSKEYPMAGLFIVGDGRERLRLEHAMHTLGLAGKVVFLGNRPDARGLMMHAQAFIQASAYEGYGRTLIEAALAKVPIITTDVGIVGEVFKDREDVLVAPVADPKTLASCITSILEDNFMRQKLPIHADAAARAHLSSVGGVPTRVAEDLLRTLQHP